MEIFGKGHNLLAITGDVELDYGKHFGSHAELPLQYGISVLHDGERLARHSHKERERIPVHKTLEFFLCWQGRVIATIYDTDKSPIDRLALDAGKFLLTIDGGHEFEIMEEDTILIEVKNGAYVSDEADKERW